MPEGKKSVLSDRALKCMKGTDWIPGKTFYLGDVAYKIKMDMSTGFTSVIGPHGEVYTLKEFKKYTSEF